MKTSWILSVYFLFIVGCAPTYIQPSFEDSNQYFLEKAIDQLDIKKELDDTFEISWSDNVKARRISAEQDNSYRKTKGPKVRSQFKLYEYYQEKRDQFVNH